MCKILTRTDNLNMREWLEWRKRGIGGSDAAAACGLSRYKSPVELWLEKTGQEAIESVSSEAAYWGTVMEPILRAEFEHRTGLKVNPVKAILQHDDIPFMLADVDGIIDVDGFSYVFEAKTASAYKASEWEDGAVPYAYQMQVQHYMAVTGAQGAYVVALIGGNKFLSAFVPRDEEAISLLIELEARFWRFVEHKIQPPIDGTDASSKLLNKLYPCANNICTELDQNAVELILQYENACDQEDVILLQKNEATNKLKEMLGDNECGRIGERVVSWKNVTASRLDGKALKTGHPDIYEQYLKDSSYRRFCIK